jgi:hypothetical protein
MKSGIRNGIRNGMRSGIRNGMNSGSSQTHCRAVDLISLAQQRYPETRRVFLADGNAIVLSSRRLVTILDALIAAFPLLRRVAEMRQIIVHLDGLSRCVFRTNHASNYLPLAGTLSRDKQNLLATLDRACTEGPAALRPEAWRAL